MLNRISNKLARFLYLTLINPILRSALKDMQIGKLNMWQRWDLRWRGVVSVLQEKAVNESVEFVERNGSQSNLCYWREDLWDIALSRVENKSNGFFLEFGVNQGISINYFADYLRKKGSKKSLVGFDSFEGLSENWNGWIYGKGHFDNSGNLPKVRSNVVLKKGWIDDTLPTFINESDVKVRGVDFVHIDVDTYGPTKTVLQLLKPFFNKGCVIIFDDFYGYNGWKEHEYRAYVEEIENDDNVEFEWIAFANRFQTALIIK